MLNIYGFRFALCWVLFLSFSGIAAGAPRSLLSPDSLDAHAVEGEFSVMPGGGPAGEPVIEFASPIKVTGSIVIDLADVDLAAFDQLHFDVWFENAPVDITATLRGYPDAFRGRRWYVMKRFQPLKQWDHVRLDLDLDDDLSRMVFEEPETSLTLAFSRPASENDAFGRVRIHNVRLVRSLVTIGVDYRAVTVLERDDALRFVYPVHLKNTSDRERTVRLELMDGTLEHFQASLAQDTATLAPGQIWTTTATIGIGSAYRDLPIGHAERTQLRVWTPEVPGFDAVPIRGYRPVYLYGVVPPRPERRSVLFEKLDAAAARLEDRRVAALADDLDWRIETPPPDVAPVYEMTFRCPTCDELLNILGLYAYACRNAACPKHRQRFEVDAKHPLFPALLGHYHSRNSVIARNMALVWRRTGEARFAEKAFEILMHYERMFRGLPMVSPNSTGHRSIFQSAVLHEMNILENFLDSYLVLRDGGFERQEELETIAEGLLLETLFNVNQHYYGVSAGQIAFIIRVMRGAIILNRWHLFADAMVGDGGMQRMLDRTFDADGIGIEGGDYARIAAGRIVELADFLNELGAAVDRDRIEQIRHNAGLFGFLPLSDDFEWQTTVLPHNGFTILANGEGPTWRRASINWGSSRERGAHDLLTTVFHDQDDEKLLLRTRRIAWGRTHSFFSYQSVSQNIPVVDEDNIRRLRLHQEYLRSDERAAGVIITDNPELSAYPESRLTRVLVLFDGVLLVLDRVRSTAGERDFNFPVYGLMRFAAMPAELRPFEGDLGETAAFRLPKNLHSMPVNGPFQVEWADGNRGLRLHRIGEGYQAFAGVSHTAWQSLERDFLMFRTRGAAATSSLLYEATHGEHPKVDDFVRVVVSDARNDPAGDDQALGYDVMFEDGRTVRMVVSLDGGTYRAGTVIADADTRIAVKTIGP